MVYTLRVMYRMNWALQKTPLRLNAVFVIFTWLALRLCLRVMITSISNAKRSDVARAGSVERVVSTGNNANSVLASFSVACTGIVSC